MAAGGHASRAASLAVNSAWEQRQYSDCAACHLRRPASCSSSLVIRSLSVIAPSCFWAMAVEVKRDTLQKQCQSKFFARPTATCYPVPCAGGSSILARNAVDRRPGVAYPVTGEGRDYHDETLVCGGAGTGDPWRGPGRGEGDHGGGGEGGGRHLPELMGRRERLLRRVARLHAQRRRRHGGTVRVAPPPRAVVEQLRRD